MKALESCLEAIPLSEILGIDEGYLPQKYQKSCKEQPLVCEKLLSNNIPKKSQELQEMEDFLDDLLDE